MSVRCVSLDAAGTLITVAEPVGHTYARLAAAPAQLGAGFRRVYPGMPPLAFDGLAGAALTAAERGWWRRLVAGVFGEAARAPGFDDFFDEVFAHYAAPDAWHVYEEVPQVLASLRALGLRLVVTSNFDSRLHGILAGTGLRAAVDAVVCSGEAGAAKPDTRIFARACEAVGCRAAETLHVGDDRRADLEGALAAGLRALLVLRDAAAEPEPAALPDLRGLPEQL